MVLLALCLQKHKRKRPADERRTALSEVKLKVTGSLGMQSRFQTSLKCQEIKFVSRVVPKLKACH